MVLELLEFEPRHIEFPTVVRPLTAISNLYAIARLVLADPPEPLERALLLGVFSDFEILLAEDERLHLDSSFSGSWILTVCSKTKENYEVIVGVVAAGFPRTPVKP